MWAASVIPGSIITIAGLVLAVQNTFDLFATWAYAWALVAPGGVGLGIAEDRGDVGVRPADLRSDVAVDVLGRDDRDPSRAGRVASASAAGHREEGDEHRRRHGDP